MTQTTISLKEAATLINNVGADVTLLLQGEPGIGKSSLLHQISEMYHKVYVDCTLLDIGDVQMPRVTDESVTFVPNNMFVSPDGKPLAIMLDEVGKVSRGVQNTLLPLMIEHRVGAYTIPEGSIVFATTNLASDGVGDAVQSHARNRVTTCIVAKPDAEQWCAWALENNVPAEVVAWVNQYPQSLASYMDASQEDNPYIFNPKKQQVSFVTPRSLEKAGKIINKRHLIGDGLAQTALEGCIGKAAAGDMAAFIQLADTLPVWDGIIADPDKTKVPENPIACVICAMGAVTRVTTANFPMWMKYMQRMPAEVQGLFAAQLSKSSAAGRLMTLPVFTQWALTNHYRY